jgi:hypothetical protein
VCHQQGRSQGGFVIIVDHKTHVPNKVDILRPILGIEDKVHNFFAIFVNCNSGGGRFGRSCILPKLIEQPLIFHLNPSLRSMEEAGDSAAPKKNGDKPLPPMGRHITAKGDEIINTPALFVVVKGRSNILRRPDEFYEARAVCSLAKTQPCAWCHHQMKIVTRSSQCSTYPTYSYV